MEPVELELAQATMSLPDEIASAMIIALETRPFRVGAGMFESELAVCPIAAAAKTVGVWADGAPSPEGAAWGSEEEMSSEVEDFVGWFDLCAEESGLEAALLIVRAALRAIVHPAFAC
jgi:hypothetical protein